MFFGIHKKMLAIIFMRNEIKFYFFGTILKEKKWCRYNDTLSKILFSLLKYSSNHLWSCEKEIVDD